MTKNMDINEISAYPSVSANEMTQKEPVYHTQEDIKISNVSPHTEVIKIGDSNCNGSTVNYNVNGQFCNGTQYDSDKGNSNGVHHNKANGNGFDFRLESFNGTETDAKKTSQAGQRGDEKQSEFERATDRASEDEIYGFDLSAEKSQTTAVGLSVTADCEGNGMIQRKSSGCGVHFSLLLDNGDTQVTCCKTLDSSALGETQENGGSWTVNGGERKERGLQERGKEELKSTNSGDSMPMAEMKSKGLKTHKHIPLYGSLSIV